MLENIGLSPAESRLYATLVDSPQSTPEELAVQCEVSANVAARVLARFVRRGLASRLPGKRPRYVAIAPDVAVLPLLVRREEELSRTRTVLNDLMTSYHRASRYTHPAELIEVVTGAENIISRALAMQEGARRSVSGINKAPYVMGTDHGNAPREYERIREGIDYRVLYDRSEMDQPEHMDDLRRSVEHGEKARVLSNPPLKLWMADDSAALIPIRTSDFAFNAAFVVYPSALLDALIALFEREWKRAMPVRFFWPDPAPDGPGLTARALLPLLAAGMTDDAIARSLNLGLRTVQRRVHELMRDLNVNTRFQAGIAAHIRGWV